MPDNAERQLPSRRWKPEERGARELSVSQLIDSVEELQKFQHRGWAIRRILNLFSLTVGTTLGLYVLEAFGVTQAPRQSGPGCQSVPDDPPGYTRGH